MGRKNGFQHRPEPHEPAARVAFNQNEAKRTI
jgi:hypothetical protein